MDINEIIQCISTVGFPIAMCVMMAYYIKSLLQSHKEDMTSIQTSINNLNLTVQKLVDAYARKENLYDDDGH